MAQINNYSDSWDGNHSGDEVEAFIKGKLQSHETSLGQKVSGVRVNNQLASKDVNVVDQSLSEESNNAVQNAAVTHEINSIKGNTIDSIRTDPVEGDSSQLDLVFTNE